MPSESPGVHSRNWNTNESFVCSDLQQAAPRCSTHDARLLDTHFNHLWAKKSMAFPASLWPVFVSRDFWNHYEATRSCVVTLFYQKYTNSQMKILINICICLFLKYRLVQPGILVYAMESTLHCQKYVDNENPYPNVTGVIPKPWSSPNCWGTKRAQTMKNIQKTILTLLLFLLCSISSVVRFFFFVALFLF